MEFALVGVFFLTPLFYGTIALGINLGRSLQAIQLSRDVGHMYAQGINFAQSGAQAIAKQLAPEMDFSSSGNAIIILSQVITVYQVDCDAAAMTNSCGNKTNQVFINRLTIGNTGLMSSRYGTPSDMNSNGDIPAATYLNSSSARVNSLFATELNNAGFTNAQSLPQDQGDVKWVVEVWFSTPSISPLNNIGSGGVYARSIF